MAYEKDRESTVDLIAARVVLAAVIALNGAFAVTHNAEPNLTLFTGLLIVGGFERGRTFDIRRARRDD